MLPTDTTGLRFRLEHLEDGGANAVRVVWSPEPVTKSIDSILSGLSREADASSPREDATEFLHEELADGPVASTELFEAAREMGISDKTLRRAFKDMGGKPKKQGLGNWEWSLPTAVEEVAIFNDGGHVQDLDLDSDSVQSPMQLEDGHIVEDGHPPGPGKSIPPSADDDSNDEEVDCG